MRLYYKIELELRMSLVVVISFFLLFYIKLGGYIGLGKLYKIKEII